MKNFHKTFYVKMTDSRAMSSITKDKDFLDNLIHASLPIIMILMDWVVCIPLLKAKAIV